MSTRRLLALVLLAGSWAMAYGQVGLNPGLLQPGQGGQWRQPVTELRWRPLLPYRWMPNGPQPQLRTGAPWASAPPPGELQAWRYHDLAFFCRLEVKLEQATRIPVRFRLGDLRQVDYLEGKRAAWE